MKKLDERQELAANKVGKTSFYIMFFVCAAVIIVQLLWKGDFEIVLGETLVLLVGGIACLAGNLKNGLWTKAGEKVSVVQNMLLSMVFSGTFSVLYAFAILRKVSGDSSVARVVVLFFISIILLCIIVLSILGRMAQHKRDEQEKKYAE